MGKTKTVVNGEEYASRGIKSRGDDEQPPTMCDVWSPSRDGDLPEKVDLRPYCTEVEDQKNSNSCCANAVAGAYEYLCKRKAMETDDSVGDISRLFIYYVGRKNDQGV
jgi:hypothetical protein